MPVVAVLEAGRGRLCVNTYQFVEGLPEAQGEVAIVSEARWVPDVDGPFLLTGEVNAGLAERLLEAPGGERVLVSTPAGCLRRAGYLAELAWERLQQGSADDLDALSPIYAHYPASGNGA